MKKVTKVFLLLVIVAIHITQTYTRRIGDRHVCARNEVWSSCTTGCPERCISDDRVCPAVCGPPGCVCASNFKLNDNGECVIC